LFALVSFQRFFRGNTFPNSLRFSLFFEVYFTERWFLNLFCFCRCRLALPLSKVFPNSPPYTDGALEFFHTILLLLFSFPRVPFHFFLFFLGEGAVLQIVPNQNPPFGPFYFSYQSLLITPPRDIPFPFSFFSLIVFVDIFPQHVFALPVFCSGIWL